MNRLPHRLVDLDEDEKAERVEDSVEQLLKRR